MPTKLEPIDDMAYLELVKNEKIIMKESVKKREENFMILKHYNCNALFGACGRERKRKEKK